MAGFASPRGSTRDIRRISRFAVLRGMYGLAAPTRQDLVRVTGLSVATVSTVVTELLGIGLLVEGDRVSSHGGRPRVRLEVAPGRGRLLGVDVAETYLSVDVFDTALTRVGRHQHPIPEGSTAEQVVDGIAEQVRTAVALHPGSPVLGVGVSMPGQVEPGRGVSVQRATWELSGVPVRRLLAERLPVPVLVDNPLTATTVAELWFGHGREVGDLITITLGTGVGAGLAIGGQLVRGVSNNAGEWGHTTLIMDGRECRCGRRGCVEAYVGAPGLRQTFRDHHGDDHPYLRDGSQSAFVGAVATGLAQAEPDAAWLLERLAHQLGVALADVVNLLNPRRVVLSSWVAAALRPWLLEPTRAVMTATAVSGSASAVELVPSAVPGSSVTLGMATLALEAHLSEVGLPSGAEARSPLGV